MVQDCSSVSCCVDAQVQLIVLNDKICKYRLCQVLVLLFIKVIYKNSKVLE